LVLLGGEAEKAHGLHPVLRHTCARLIANAQVALRAGMLLLGGEA